MQYSEVRSESSINELGHIELIATQVTPIVWLLQMEQHGKGVLL